MTVTSLDVRDEYTATSGQTIFNYTFKIYSVSDLNVYITPAGQSASDSDDLTTAYVVDPATVGNVAGGFITLNTGASSGELVTIVSNIASNRVTDYQNSGDFEPDTVNDDFDRTLSLVKQQLDSTSRTLSFPQSLQDASALSLPLPSAGLYVVWNGAEDGLINAGAPGTVIDSSLNGTTVQMVANASLSAGDVIISTGYNTAGDYGNNTFLARAVTGATADGGSLIKGVGNAAIEFVGLFPGKNITPQMFGVVSNGVTQNLTTWNLMITYVNALGGATIYCPEGSYNFGNTQGANLPSNSIIKGDGIGATIFVQLSSSTNRGGFDLDGVSNLTLRDFTVQGTRAGDTVAVDNTGFLTTNTNGANNILFEDIEVKDFGYYGIELRDCDDVMINRCRLTDLGRAGVLGIGCLRNHVHNSFIKDISPGSGGVAGFLNRFGITFSMDESTPGRRSTFCSAVGNHIENVDSWEGIDTHGGTDILIDGNTIINCAIGIFVGSATSTANLPPERWRIVNNRFSNAGNAVSRAAILLAASPDAGTTVGHQFIIEGNYIQQYGTHDETVNQEGAVDVTFARDVIIANNNFRLNQWSHIRLGEDIINCQITGNTFIRGLTINGFNYVLNAQNAGDVQANFDNNTAYREGGLLDGIIIQSLPSNETTFGIKVGANNRFIDLDNDFHPSAAGRMHSQSGIFITDTTNATIASAGTVQSSNNVTSVVKSSTGVYDFTLTKGYINANAMKGAVNAAGTADIGTTFTATAATTFTVRTFNQAGTLADNDFTVKVNGKINEMP